MKAIIAAGGRATRMRPITHTINKHLIPLANRPMIWYAIEKIVDAGIRDILINVNPGEVELQKSIGDGSRWGSRIRYVEQAGGPCGLAHIISNAEPLIGDEPFLFYLGDNIVLGSIKNLVDAFYEEKADAMLALSKVPDPNRFGVPVIENGRIIKVIEKPEKPPSPFAVTGMYVYSPRIFEAAKSIRPSERGELEISDAHTWLIEHGGHVGFREVTGWWKDTGKPSDLLVGNALLLDLLTKEDSVQAGDIHADATVSGRVRIGKGTRIGANTILRGPVVIGENCTIESSYIGPFTSIGDNADIRNTEIEHSLIMNNVRIQARTRIVDAIIGMSAQVRSAGSSLPSGHKLIIGDHTVVEL
ncbi:MAG: glucose-1-phosphate thymidylyltransferase [bacterium]|nr:glucose-1-phosphate thymidylyltransferase [bacterium]